jgi:alcohol dehydrogenase class IV
MLFEFATATRIIFGEGAVKQVGAIAGQMGKRALVVTGLPEILTLPLIENLKEAHIDPEIFYSTEEPTIEHIAEAKQLAIQTDRDVIIGFGGGSSIDTAKATAALVTNQEEITDYLEVIGLGKQISKPPLNFIAVPTSAGTGAEVTRNAVLTSTKHRVKVSLRSPMMLAKVAIIDPELTYSLPPAITASTGMDALTQVIEPFVSRRSNPMTDCICQEGISRGARSLLKAYQKGDDPASRLDMSITSLFGGLALANAGLGAAHGFAGPIGGLYNAPHGAICAILLPYVMEMNIKALKIRQPESDAIGKYDEIAKLLTGNSKAVALDGMSYIVELVQMLGIPTLKQTGMTFGDIPQVVDLASKASSMKGNPIDLTKEEMIEILYKAM